MALEIINEIRDTEAQAQKIRQDAQANSKALIKEAQEKGELSIAQAEKKAREESASLVAQANEKAKEIALLSQNDEAAKKETMYALSGKNMEKAAGFIIEELKKQ